MTIQVEVIDSGIQVALARLQRKMANLRPVMQQIGEDVVASTQLRFRDQESPSGQAWKELSDVTKALRRKGNGSGELEILSDNRILKNSLTRAKGAITVTANSVTVGTNVPYAAIHQFGGMAGRNRKVSIPARPFLGISADDRQEIITNLSRYFAAED